MFKRMFDSINCLVDAEVNINLYTAHRSNYIVLSPNGMDRPTLRKNVTCLPPEILMDSVNAGA
jgi:hypothetical protein